MRRISCCRAEARQPALSEGREDHNGMVLAGGTVPLLRARTIIAPSRERGRPARAFSPRAPARRFRASHLAIWHCSGMPDGLSPIDNFKQGEAADVTAQSVASAISAFGASAKAKLSNAAISGQPEDQLRAPLDALFRQFEGICGLASGPLDLVGETSLSDLKIRPDFAVTVNKALVGFIEVKAPGKGSDPRKFADPHDKAQWAKLKSLPNLLYTVGNGFSLWRNGEPAGKPALFDGDIETAGSKLVPPPNLLALVTDFLTWHPEPPKSPPALAKVAARLCRLLRDEVLEQMEHGNESLKGLASDWRKLLFPNADDAQFADGYAQAVTFGLLMTRALDIPLDGGIDLAALKLKKQNSLIGTALGLLTENAANQEALKTSLGTLTRVLNEVDWHAISKDKADAWLYFYEDFLAVYDNKLRKATGSYYTHVKAVRTSERFQ